MFLEPRRFPIRSFLRRRRGPPTLRAASVSHNELVSTTLAFVRNHIHVVCIM
jgi:hypothetical protein